MYDKKLLQNKLLEIAKEIDVICKENNITYYLSFGSCLGAIRHQGFIPWDDDFDVMMPWPDYLKFVEVCKNTKNNNSKYFVQTRETEVDYKMLFGKFLDTSTTMVEGVSCDWNTKKSVHIDVFPLVAYPTGRLRRLKFQICRAYAISVYSNMIHNKYLYNGLQLLMKLFRKEKLMTYFGNQCTKYEYSKYQDVSNVFDGDGVEVNLTTRTILGKPKYVPFEDTFLPVPEDADAYLTKVYGD